VIAIDTNVLVRYYIDDDHVQHTTAKQFIFLMRVLVLLLLCLSGVALAKGDLPFEVGQTPPDHLGRDIEWNDVHLSNYPDRVRVVSFWAG
jgi:hypothetical protein